MQANLDARLPAHLAALAAGVSKQLFNYWRTSGKIRPDEDGLYRYGDVLAVEADMRKAPQSSRRRPATGRGSWAELDRKPSSTRAQVSQPVR